MKDSTGSLAFNGQGGAGFSRMPKGECVNQYTGKANDGALINKGRGPTGGGTKVPMDKDLIRGSAQVRTPGGTRAFDPKAGQNYKGNSDKINVGRGPTKGNM